jgi:hypothetical protein
MQPSFFNICNPRCPFGTKVRSTCVIDTNGICQVQSEYDNDVESTMDIVKTKYWSFEIQRDTMVIIEPEGWLLLRVHWGAIMLSAQN